MPRANPSTDPLTEEQLLRQHEEYWRMIRQFALNLANAERERDSRSVLTIQRQFNAFLARRDDDTRPFPIQGGWDEETHRLYPSAIPWWLAEIAYEFYGETFGTSQSLEELAERGGFGREELVLFIKSQP